MALSNTARFLIAAIFVAVVVVAGLLVMRTGGPGGKMAADVETDVILDDDGKGRCSIQTKADQVDAHADRKVTWNVNDTACDYKDEVATVGNFRSASASTATDCLAAVEGGAAWPFVEPEGDIKHRQNTNPSKIELHIKPSNGLPGSGPTVSYYYDICTGASAEVKSDPLLVIEK